MAGEGAHQRAVAALGPQVGVDGPDGALDGGLGADPHHVRGEPGGGLHAPCPRRRPSTGLADEDHVDVGDVVQLVAAALAHRDDGEPAQRRRPRARRRGRWRGRRAGWRWRGRRVRRRSRRGRSCRTRRGPRWTAGSGGRRRAATSGSAASASPRSNSATPGCRSRGLVGDEGLPVARVPGEMVAERRGGAEHAEQPVAQRLGADQGVEQLAARRPSCASTQPDEAEQREVGVGGRPERVQQHRVGAYGGQLGQSSSRSAAEGSVKPCRSSRVKVLLRRPSGRDMRPPGGSRVRSTRQSSVTAGARTRNAAPPRFLWLLQGSAKVPGKAGSVCWGP